MTPSLTHYLSAAHTHTHTPQPAWRTEYAERFMSSSQALVFHVAFATIKCN